MHAFLGQFVLNIDNIAYLTFSAQELKQALRDVGELTVKKHRAYAGLDGTASLKFVAALICTFAVALPAFIIPQASLLNDAGNALCGLFACMSICAHASARA